MRFSRRKFVELSVGAAAGFAGERLLAQGMGGHAAKAVARQAPSGRPFNAHFVDVAVTAGLHDVTIYGGAESNKYILESDGCGCAFIDYDNDGWMDIFLLSGTRLDGPPAGAGNRLYKNNRDGTFTDVTEKAGLKAVGWGDGVCIGDYNNDGFDDIFCTYFGQNTLY
ncbi:MAG: VCBS repeat-containing protein, partial [Candidatus Acidiferrum sp.]